MGIQFDGINNEINSQTKIDFPGSIGIAGTLTYEDVANVDSIGIITARTGVIVGSGVTLNATGVIATGVITATSFVGSGANLTSLPAGNLTGTVADARLTSVTASKLSGALPALDGSALTGVGVGTADSINTSGIITATAFVPTTGQLSHRNIAINGAMTIAQRGTSSNATSGYHTVDRWEQNHGSTDEAPTFTTYGIGAPSSPYHLPTTGPHPYREGFRTGWGVMNGNQTSGAGADDNILMGYAFEAQDIVNSGWDYTNPNSYITLSFWIKSSVSQEFFGQMLTQDGTIYNYPFGTGALTAFTWKKVVKTIPGNANITFNNDTGPGLRFYLWAFAGTNLTGNVTNDAWMVNNYSTRVSNNTTTWYTTNDASLQITGFQLEVGSVATPFEHRSYNEELQRCKRYYQQYPEGPHADNYIPIPSACCACNSGTLAYYTPSLFPGMRSSPSFSTNGNFRVNGTSGLNNVAVTAIGVYHNGSQSIFQYVTIASGFTAGHAVILSVNNDASAYIAYNAEL